MDLLERILRADPRAMARAMTLIENEDPRALPILKALFTHTGQAQIIGITGAPGSGKSTLVDQLAQEFRRRNETVGIVAVDPTSPFSGGALLADRIRMSALYNDEGVFIRSMATRGHLGGLARTTAKLISVMDAAGKKVILVETVGVGQDEVEIVKVADISIVVLVPGMGDDVQAFKAGIMEIGDIFVINKSEHPQTDKMERDLQAALSLSRRSDDWVPPIVRTIAVQGSGILELMGKIAEFDRYREASPGRANQRQDTVEENLINLLRELLLEKAIQQNGLWDKIHAASQAVRELRPSFEICSKLILRRSPLLERGAKPLGLPFVEVFPQPGHLGSLKLLTTL
jgi:LAO/AO transport system kinase